MDEFECLFCSAPADFLVAGWLAGPTPWFLTPAEFWPTCQLHCNTWGTGPTTSEENS